jgi:hypothetical protein
MTGAADAYNKLAQEVCIAKLTNPRCGEASVPTDCHHRTDSVSGYSGIARRAMPISRYVFGKEPCFAGRHASTTSRARPSIRRASFS